MRRLVAGLLFLVLASATAARAGELSPVEQALQDWRAARGRPLRLKVEAARKLAGTRDVAALKELLGEYARDGRNQDKFRELVAPILALEFGGAEFALTLRDALLDPLKSPEHAWLAHRVAGQWIADGRPAVALDLCMRSQALPFHQAAVLRAFAAAPDANAASLAREVMETLPTAEPQRTLLLTAAARVVEANAPTDDPAAMRGVVRPLLERLAEKQTTRRTATLLGRSLARMLGSDVAYADAETWRRFMDDRDVAEKLEREGYAPSRTYFAGVVLTGRDIVFVIDSSGSMNWPFTWRPETPKEAPTPGKGETEKERRDRRARAEQDVFDSLKSLPWEKIHTRLDAVREALKSSLRALRDDQRFAVVVFEDDARFVSSSHLLQATRENVDMVCGGLDRLRADGATNVHRGLEMAFGASRAALEDPATGTGVDQVLQGADTVVLLTDGAPTTDDYDVKGAFSPLYCAIENLCLATRRWNLFLDAEVDCVGLADADAALLARLAAVGNGKARFLGR